MTMAGLLTGCLAFAQPSPGVFWPSRGCNIFPATASVGTTVGLSYFGPPPSTTNPSFVGPLQLLKSGVVDDQKGTITLRLYQETRAGTQKLLWFILTDVSDREVASLPMHCEPRRLIATELLFSKKVQSNLGRCVA